MRTKIEKDQKGSMVKQQKKSEIDYEVFIIGAGFSGFGFPILLEKSGCNNFLILEQAYVGDGKSNWDTYPDVVVNIPLFRYQFSFEQRYLWLHIYTPDMELKNYAEHRVRKFALWDRILLTVFLLTPIWCLTRIDISLSSSQFILKSDHDVAILISIISQTAVEVVFSLFGYFATAIPTHKIASRVVDGFLRKQEKSSGIREKLTARYDLGYNRPSFSKIYFSTFNRSNGNSITLSIAKIFPDGIETIDGVKYEEDILLLAADVKVFGFDNRPAFSVTSSMGMELGEWWIQNRHQAHEKGLIPGYPNFFIIFGHYRYKGSSYFTLMENQARHSIRCTGESSKRKATKIEITQKAHDQYSAKVLVRPERQIFFQGQCEGSNSYYLSNHEDAPLRPALTLGSFWSRNTSNRNDYCYQ
ncbi:MAG: hypothetical protein ACRCSF_08395 [Mycobacteriaceae bacterium]